MWLILIILTLAILIEIFKYWIRSPTQIGKRGEFKAATTLNALNNDKYCVLNDIMVETGRKTYQIDHIVVSVFGLFVIETKNYSGWIFGNEKSEYWTQVNYKIKSRFRNPIKQNWSHIYALKTILNEFPDIIYHPIVVFTGNAELKEITSTLPVIYQEQLNETIVYNSQILCLTEKHMNEIIFRLDSKNITNKKQREAHIYQTQMNISERTSIERSQVCPKCGGNLKIRDGKYGKFYGCSNYPKCHYTRPY